MDYPSVWLWVGRAFALQVESHYLIFCGASAAAFVGACAYLLYRFPSWWLLLAAISPVSMLAIERGNNDIDAFLLLFMFAGASRWLSIIPFALAVLAKLYPLFAVHAALAKRDLLRAAVMMVIVLFVIVLLRQEIPLMLHGNSADGPYAYGAKILWSKTGIAAPQGSWHLGSVLLKIVVVLAAVGAVLIAFRMAPKTTCNPLSHGYFLVGGSIYSYTYLVAANWDYRMIFLTMCVPYLVDDEARRYGKVAACMLLVALSGPWIAFQGHILPIVLLMAQAGLFVLLLPLLFDPLLIEGRLLVAKWNGEQARALS